MPDGVTLAERQGACRKHMAEDAVGQSLAANAEYHRRNTRAMSMNGHVSAGTATASALLPPWRRLSRLAKPAETQRYAENPDDLQDASSTLQNPSYPSGGTEAACQRSAANAQAKVRLVTI